MRRNRRSEICRPLFARTGDETSTAFGAPGIQDFATATGGHACAKTVGTCALYAAWLEGTFHHRDSDLVLLVERDWVRPSCIDSAVKICRRWVVRGRKVKGIRTSCQYGLAGSNAADAAQLNEIDRTLDSPSEVSTHYCARQINRSTPSSNMAVDN